MRQFNITVNGVAYSVAVEEVGAASAPVAAPVAAPVVTPVAAPAPVADPAPAASEGVSVEVIAAITAAIAAVWQAPTGFVVRHVKRVNNAPAWNRAGREEQTYSRF